MFRSFSGIFNFLRPGRTKRFSKALQAMTLQRKQSNIILCHQILSELDAAEADVLNELNNPETAWPFLAELRQLRRQTEADLAHLTAENLTQPELVDASISEPVREVTTRTGLHWQVFNGGQVR